MKYQRTSQEKGRRKLTWADFNQRSVGLENAQRLADVFGSKINRIREDRSQLRNTTPQSLGEILLSIARRKIEREG